MAFTVTEIQRGTIAPHLRYVILRGVNSGGSTGGDFPTGFNRVLFAALTEESASVDNSGQVINEAFPLESGDVTVVTTANVTVNLFAVGE